ncbi:MAG: site-specific DNA-methyltransferase [Methanogenium sp.]|nr:site-specific DNA-methyltransferase [Methanogenium sp.]
MTPTIPQQNRDRMEEHKARLRSTLRELFQIDSPDLNFGLYRIMNQNKDEIQRFMNKDLIDAVDEEFGKYDKSSLEDIRKKLDDLKQEIKEKLGYDTLTANGVKQDLLSMPIAAALQEKWDTLHKKEEAAGMSDIHKSEIFSHLADFFSRYYDNGDFMPLRRYSTQGKYAVPYNGEEVLLHWANKDQYYIKTSEQLNSHGFSVGNYEIAFEVIHAETSENNNKSEDRYFVLSSQINANETGAGDENHETNVNSKNPVSFNKDTKFLTVRFSYVPFTKEEAKVKFPPGATRQSPNRDDIVSALADTILSHDCIPDSLKSALDRKEKETDKNSTLKKHIAGFIARHDSDFFIHKDLGGFLSGELNFYIKNEVFRLDDLGVAMTEVEVAKYTHRALVIKNIASRIIGFLAQLENFQKMLWEKKKFVLKNHYCLTLDIIPDEFWESHATTILSNNAQLAEWKNLYGFTPDDSSKGQSSHPHLALDTRFFDDEFTWDLLSHFDNLDDTTGGLMIKSENWQALNLLQENYREQVKCIYIDPPYNTGSDEFIYKDRYQHSSWLSMMWDRITQARNLMYSDSTIYTSIDDGEQSQLRELQNIIFGSENFVNNIIWQKKFSPQNDARWFSDNHDFILSFAKDKDKWRPNLLPRTEEHDSRYSNPDNDSRGPWTSGDLSVKTYSAAYDFPITTPSGRIVIPPESRCWFTSKDKMELMIKDNRIWFGKEGNNVPRMKRFLSEVKSGITPLTIWTYSEVGHNQEGKQELKSMLSEGDEVFGTPKVVRLLKRIITIGADNNSIVLDFFAGSGTTAHAVLNLNKEDGGSRKYILVEMGDYFETVTKPRVQKVVYSDKWKDGKPLPEGEGQSHMFCYQYLESYEDTLDNIEFPDESGQVQKQLFSGDGSSNDFMLNYFLDFSTRQNSPCRLNKSCLSRPFDYTLKLRRHTGNGYDDIPEDENGFKHVTVDLVETFNYLLGLKVRKKKMWKRHAGDGEGHTYRVVHGKTRDNTTVTVVWRNCPEDPAGHEEELREDEKYIDGTILKEFPGTDVLYVNGHCYHKDSRPIEPKFKKLMGA